MTIVNWPEQERPFSMGAQVLSNAQLLAIFIGARTKGKTAIDISRGLLVRYGSLKGILEANVTGFCQTSGIAPAKYTHIMTTLELGRWFLEEQVREELPNTSPYNLEGAVHGHH
jgi:DNA repair protein RadC